MGTAVPDCGPGDEGDRQTLRELGRAVRTRRTQLGLTLSQVAEGTGLSVPFLSQVETSFAAPSLTSLFSIARVLDTTPERLLAGPVAADVVLVASGEGGRYPVTDADRSGFRRQLTRLGEPFSAAEYVVDPGSDLGGFHASAGRELIHVTAGVLAVDLEHGGGEIETHELAIGDTMIYSTGVRHRWRHRGRSATRFVHVSVDP
jgi:transcriptional regulator with XRE-family HTH domain